MKVCTRFSQHPKYGAGGAERQMMLIAGELQKKNVDFHYYTRKYLENQKKLEIINGVKIHALGYRINYNPRKIKEKLLNFVNLNDLSLYYKHFRDFNYDIFHFRGSVTIIGNWSFFAKVIKKKKFVFTASSIYDCIPGSHPISKSMQKFYDYGIKKADIVIALTNDMKRALNQNYCINSVIIKSGHPVPKEPFKKDNPPTILWVSRLVNYKRPELFLRIAKELEDLNAKFLLISPGDYKKKEIMKFSKEHKNFTFIPGVPSGKDNYYYERASLFVNTSIYEGFPNTFIQAWLHETPVVSLDIDPDCDICNNGLGYHAKGNLNKLINEIKDLIENPDKLKEMGINSRRYAIKNHDIEKTAGQHYKLYQWLLKKH